MNRITIIGGCVKASPVFCGEIRELEARHHRFDAGLIAGGIRSTSGRLQVIVCRPVSQHGEPFPTTFWLTDTELMRRAGQVETLGGVHELEEYMRSRKLYREWREYTFRHQAVRLALMGENLRKFMRRFRPGMFRTLMHSGIGGMKITDTISVKCLHLQTASFIAMGYHPASEWLRSKGLC